MCRLVELTHKAGRRGRRSHLANSNGVVARKTEAAVAQQQSHDVDSTSAATVAIELQPQTADVDADKERRRARKDLKR